jgi:hypothetical protein
MKRDIFLGCSAYHAPFRFRLILGHIWIWYPRKKLNAGSCDMNKGTFRL